MYTEELKKYCSLFYSVSYIKKFNVYIKAYFKIGLKNVKQYFQNFPKNYTTPRFFFVQKTYFIVN